MGESGKRRKEAEMGIEIIANQPLLSIVVPLFNEEQNLSLLYDRLVKTLEADGGSFELVFVNDGSRDATPRLLDEICANDSRVVVISLSRNFGHQAAICAGIDQAQGKAVVLMDGDLQDPPEALPAFIDAWRDGNDVVYAVRTKRKESLFKRCCYATFYRVFRAVSDIDIPLDAGDFCLMDRKVVEALKQLPERNRFVRGLRSFVGFKQIGVTYERAARFAGEAKYTFRALCQLAMDGVFGFSNAPIRIVTYSAIAMLLATVGFGATATAKAIADGELSGSWIITLALLGCTCVQLFALAVIGEYVRRMFQEVKHRPTYVIGSVKQSVRETESPRVSTIGEAA